MEFLENLKDSLRNSTIYIIGKGPSLRNFLPFDYFKDKVCIGINNVYKIFPYCSYIVFWHADIYYSDAEYLRTQKDFKTFYSSFHSLPKNLPNAFELAYCGDFPVEGSEFGTLSYWRKNNDKWMFKTTFATAIKLACWMGASRILMIGFDFSVENGITADDDLLIVPTNLIHYTNEEILALQYKVFKNLRDQLYSESVILERLFSNSELNT